MNEATNPPKAEKAAGSEGDLYRLERIAIFGSSPDDDRTARESLWGLALSGGGIRSATFALGVLQGLAECGYLNSFHYLSTVSGGGYAGAYLQAMLHRHGVEDTVKRLAAKHRRSSPPPDETIAGPQGSIADPIPSAQIAVSSAQEEQPDEAVHVTGANSDAVLALRKFSNFLSPDKTALSGDRISIATHYATNLLVIQFLITPPLLMGMLVISFLYWGALQMWSRPDLLSAVAVGLVICLVWMLCGKSKATSGGRKRLHQRLAADDDVAIFGAAATVLALTAMLLWPAILRTTTSAAAPIGVKWLYHHPWAIPTSAGILYCGLWLLWAQRSRVPTQVELWKQRSVEWLATLLGGGLVVGGLALAQKHHVELWLPAGGTEPFLLPVLAIGTAIVLIILFIAGSVSLGAASLVATDNRIRPEQWARFSSKAALGVAAGILLPLALVSLPRGIAAVLPTHRVLLLMLTVALGGVLVLRREIGDSLIHRHLLFRALRKVAIAVSPWALVVAILLATAWLAQKIFGYINPTPCSVQFSWALRCQSYLLRNMDSMDRLWFAGALVLSWVVWRFAIAGRVDENEFSMNGFYRNRLVQCYLAPTAKKRNGDEFDPADDLRLHELLDPRPTTDSQTTETDSDKKDAVQKFRPLYPLICCAVNLTARKHLDWQDRKAGSFVLSPLYCGHWSPRDAWTDATDTRRAAGDAYGIGDKFVVPELAGASRGWRTQLSDASKKQLAGKISLGTAMSISGAAISPNMGYLSASPVTFLLTLFNLRLGLWV